LARRWLGLIDLALLVTAALMVVTDATVLLFHLIFVCLALGAFFWEFRPFAVRVLLWVTAVVAVVVAAVLAGRTPAEELIEIPLMVAILVLIFAIAGRRARAEAELRQAESRNRQLVESVQAIVWRADAQTLQFNFVSKEAEALLGYPVERWTAEPTFWRDHLHPDDCQWAVDFCMQATARMEPHAFEYRMLAADGRVVWLRDMVRIIAEDKRPKELIGVMVDVTERKRTEAALREANEKLTQGLNALEQHNREIALLNQMGDLLQTCHTAEEAGAVVADFGAQFFPGEAGALYVIDPESNLGEAVAAWGELASGSEAHTFAPDDCWALRRGRIHIVAEGAPPPGADPGPELVCRHMPSPKPAAAMCVPMMARGEAMGILYLQRAPPAPDGPRPAKNHTGWVEAQQGLAKAVADSAALALANVRLRETLRHQSIRDPLTGLFNRRYLEETLERELHRAARGHRPVGVIMLDLDHFKRFNDTFGHAAGDALLHELGKFLRAHVRGEDVACRYGGEEFTLVLSDAPRAVARQRAERLREEVKRLQPRHGGRPLGAVTLSLGVAVFPDHGSTGEDMLKAADAALYRAKRGGRDRVVVVGEDQD
jgi:diguanylate cyclase (GGDEF)-like protein/PAS domain S-box-containing protein